MKSVCLALLLPGMLAACASAPRVAEAPVPTPLQWQMPMSDAGEGSDAGFWSGFASPELDRLLQRAAIANPDLQIAVRRLRIADDAERLAAAGKRPALDFQAGPVDNTAVAVNGGRRSAAVYRLGFEASYELDFWGRIDNQIAGAKADAAGQRFEAGAARIAMADELAHRYFDIAEADEVRVLLQRRAALADERWTLETARQAAGRIDAGPVLEAQRARNQLQDELADWQQRRQQDIWQLALLCGELPEAFTLAASPLRQAIRRPSVPSGLPSSLLQRRPDLQAASSRLQAAQAQIGVAWAEQFPQIRLTAELGVASDVLHRVLSGAILPFGIGPSISLPLLDGGARAARLDASQQAAEIAETEYRKAALAAFVDVELALQAHADADSRQRQSEQTAAWQQQLAQRSAAQQQAGRANRIDAITLESARLEAEQLAVDRYRQQLDALLALHAALGGGWSAPDLALASSTSAINEPSNRPGNKKVTP
ncbi:efflux transporter outer membrane subunit [Nevskia ramosa]|uniref:efflux transporter outer membrane subunit n=1 Tax=Nevskia ramosa TaxID=64002 RepID=UPI00042489AE|nr:efflux transporter outer membrane subunit [Nevskia ramosa]